MMDANSLEKGTGGFNEKYGAYTQDRMDGKAHVKKEDFVDGLNNAIEAPCHEMQVYSNEASVTPSLPLIEVKEERTQSPLVESNSVESSLPVTKLEEMTEAIEPLIEVKEERTQSPLLESDSVESSLPVTKLEEMTEAIEPNLGINAADKKTSDYGTEGEGNPIEDYQKHELLDAEAGTTFNDLAETGDLNQHLNDPSDQGDNDHYDSVDTEYYDNHSAKPSATDALNEDFGHVSAYPQPVGVEDNEEMDDESLNQKSSHQSPVRGRYSSEMDPPENGGMVWENSSLLSTQETRNVSPSLERRLSVSAERSPHLQSPPKGHTSPRQELPSQANLEHKSAPSPRSPSRINSPSPEKHSSGRKGASSRDRSSPSTRQKSPSVRASKQEVHHSDDSSRRRLSRSPRKHDSPRRRERSASKSPMRRRVSPGYRRDHRRSRSRSPIGRGRNRRSPRRHSPRRRSPPPHHSRRRSPRRPWSPPANRNTGIGKPGKNLFVAGFSYVTTEKDLERKFSKFGRVTDVRIVRDRRSGDSRGFGFLSLERDEDADAAIRAVDQTEWNGRIVLVEKSKTATR